MRNAREAALFHHSSLGVFAYAQELKGAVRTLVALLPADTLPAVVSEVLGVLGQSELRTVTAEEHAIYTTPEGTLFNKAVLSRLGPPFLQNKTNILVLFWS